MIKLFTIKFDRSLEKFDDNEFQNYIKDKDVLSVENHFFICREIPYVHVSEKQNPALYWFKYNSAC
jgi:hypothetical protein